MLIDDDDAVRTVLSEQFSDAGSIVKAFASGDAAVAAMDAEDATYDFILSDFAMPGLDGIKTLDILGPAHPKARMAVMTGNAEDPRLSDDQKVAIIKKPLKLESLAEVFRQYG